MEIRIKLKQAREENKLTQRDVASHLEMAETSYQRIELGLRGTSEENWLKLFDLFDKKIPLNKLMENTTHRELLAKSDET